MGDRDKLMQEITFGLKLRPTKTVDRSKPIIHADGETFKNYGSVKENLQQDVYSQCTSTAPPPPPPPPPSLNGHHGLVPAGKKSLSNGLQTSEKPRQKQLTSAQKEPASREALMNQIKGGQFKLKPVQVVDKTILKLDPQDVHITKGSNNVNNTSYAQDPATGKMVPPQLPAQHVIGQLQETLAKRFASSQRSYDSQPPEYSHLGTEVSPQAVMATPYKRKVYEETIPVPVVEPIYYVPENLVECDSSISEEQLSSSGSLETEDSGVQHCGDEIFYCKPATRNIDMELANGAQEYNDGVQAPRLLRSFEPVFRKSVDNDHDEEEQGRIKSADFLARILKEKMESHPQPKYPFRKPSTSENDQLKEMIQLVTSLAQPEKIMAPPSMPPPPVPTKDSSFDEQDREIAMNNFKECYPREEKVEEIKTSKYSPENYSVLNSYNSRECADPEEDTNRMVNFNGSGLHNQSLLHSATVAKPREHIIEVKRLPPTSKLNNGSPVGFKSEMPHAKSVEKIVNKFQNGQAENGVHTAKLVKPREHIIEIKRLPVPHMYEQTANPVPDQTSWTSKTLPRKISNGKLANDDEPRSFHSNGSAQQMSNEAENSRYPPYVRRNSDPNLLECDDDNVVSMCGTGMFRKVFPNVSQLRNRFEYAASDTSSTKSSPTEPLPSQMFVCKPAVAIPIPPSSGPQISVSTKFDERSYPRGEIVRKMSSASDSSFSSSDTHSPRSTGKREMQSSNFGDSRSSSESVNLLPKMNGRVRGESVPNSMFTAHPLLMGGMGQRNTVSPANESSQRKANERGYYGHLSDQERRGSSPTVTNVPVTTWKVKKESIPQTVNKYAISKTLEDMHQRQLDSMNVTDNPNRHVINGMTFDDKFDAEVANIVGMSLEDFKQFRFQIDLTDPEGTFLQLQKKLYQQQH